MRHERQESVPSLHADSSNSATTISNKSDTVRPQQLVQSGKELEGIHPIIRADSADADDITDR